MISLSSQVFLQKARVFCPNSKKALSFIKDSRKSPKLIEPIQNFFAALFLASIGMLIHLQFSWNHVDILLASVILVIIIKTFIVSLVVKGFGYTNKTSLLVRNIYDFTLVKVKMLKLEFLILLLLLLLFIYYYF